MFAGVCGLIKRYR